MLNMYRMRRVVPTQQEPGARRTAVLTKGRKEQNRPLRCLPWNTEGGPESVPASAHR